MSALDHLTALFGEREGFIFVAHAVDRYVTDTGKVAHNDFTEVSYSYPRELDRLVADVDRWVAAAHDVWFTPSLSGNPLRESAKRKKLPVSTLWADLDDTKHVDRVRTLVDGGAWLVASGGKDRRHLYLPLAEAVPADQAEDLNYRLATYLDADRAPTWHGSYLRPTGTLNHKAPTLGTGPAGAVELINASSGGRWPVQLLDDLLPAAERHTVDYAVPDAEPLDDLNSVVRGEVKRVLDEPVTVGMDRSERVYAAVARLRDLGLSDGQVLTAMQQHPPAVDRQRDGTNLERDVARCLAKLAPALQLGTASVESASPMSLDDAHAVFRRWLGNEYDLDALDAMLATVAVEQLTGDPVWLLIISGSGNAKTETVQSAIGAGALVTSTITSVGALLSATSKKERSKDSTGGLLRRIGGRGVLVIKDMTSILSQNTNTRAEVLAALREVYDGYWERNVGTDGGRSLEWGGRIAVVGAVTTAWDRAHEVISSMGDRFVLLRSDSTVGRKAAGRRSIGNTGSEIEMREELAAAVGGVIAGVDPAGEIALTAAETELLIDVADLVSTARTAVDYDYQGRVIDSHSPEMPTRFAKQLAQVVRGGIAIGLERTAALHLAIRCGRDSMPPMRLSILLDVAAHPYSTAYDVRKRIDKPYTTVDRQLQSLHMLGLLTVDEDQSDKGTRWRYSVAAGFNDRAFELSPEMLVSGDSEKEKGSPEEAHPPSHISGSTPVADRLIIAGVFG